MNLNINNICIALWITKIFNNIKNYKTYDWQTKKKIIYKSKWRTECGKDSEKN